jgi:hypothetical protein
MLNSTARSNALKKTHRNTPRSVGPRQVLAVRTACETDTNFVHVSLQQTMPARIPPDNAHLFLDYRTYNTDKFTGHDKDTTYKLIIETCRCLDEDIRLLEGVEVDENRNFVTGFKFDFLLQFIDKALLNDRFGNKCLIGGMRRVTLSVSRWRRRCIIGMTEVTQLRTLCPVKLTRSTVNLTAAVS